MGSPTYRDIERLAYQGVRLEITGGRTTWEAYPGALHNGVVDDIRHNLTQDNLSTTAPCGYHHIANTYVRRCGARRAEHKAPPPATRRASPTASPA